jgi:uncharacterized protein (DUF2147 family)
MRLLVRYGVMLGCAALLPAQLAQAAAEEASFGVWSNPQNSVHVRAHRCGSSMCGTVIWASEKAKQDARKGGTAELIGAQLFQNFVKESATVWRGKVFVPDINKTFSGTISLIDDRHLKGQGCLLGRVLCKSQVWTRVDDARR